MNPSGPPGGFTEECDSRNVYHDIYAIPVGSGHLHYQNERLSGRANDGVIVIMDGVYWAHEDAPIRSSAVHRFTTFINTGMDEKFQRHTN
ncbi:hypothetical protein VZT92_014439 [Zoarces viviparus]|uniref:Uncharacterized protein n=1 Tax=Zoarces viviparus TaxID=48416 RepID=A0AAW1EZX3_ZOAVI